MQSDYLKRPIIRELKNKLQYIDKLKGIKSKNKVIATMDSDEILEYIKDKNESERIQIITALPDSKKVEFIGLNILSEEETKKIVCSLREIGSILELDSNYLKLWRKYGDTQIIIENIDLFLQKEGVLSEEDRSYSIAILSKMYETNSSVYNSINFKLLYKKYIDFLGEDKINQFSVFSDEQVRLLKLGNREDFSLEILSKCISQFNDTKWTQLVDVLLKNITSGGYDESIECENVNLPIEIKKENIIIRFINFIKKVFSK